MARTPEEVYAEIAAWPLEERLRLLARLLERAADELARERPSPPSRRPSAAPPGKQVLESATRDERPQPRGSSPSLPPRDAASAPAHAAATGPRATDPKAGGAREARRMLLIDGSNFLGTVPGFDLSTEAARDELILRLQDFAHAHPSTRVVVYFDGRKTTIQRAGGVEVRFSPGQRPADFYLLESLRALTAAERQRAVLVTADRALADAALKLGAKVEAPSSFHHRLPGPRRTTVGERGLSPAEVADWETYFQQPPNPDRRR